MAQEPTYQQAEQDEFILDTPVLRKFVSGVKEAISEANDVDAALDALQPHFAALLADQSWLSDEFAAPYEASGMGGGIASWLLYRAGDHSLSLISLVVPPGSETPVHDHLAWGLVGLYRGEQRETVYAWEGDGMAHSHAFHGELEHGTGEVEGVHLKVAEVNRLKPGDFYRLIPPDGDIHSVKTTSQEPSISIHLLSNDIGCIVRHAFDPEKSTARAFRSGYSNMACDADEEAPE